MNGDQKGPWKLIYQPGCDISHVTELKISGPIRGLENGASWLGRLSCAWSRDLYHTLASYIRVWKRSASHSSSLHCSELTMPPKPASKGAKKAASKAKAARTGDKKRGGGGGRATPSTSTRCSSRCILTLASAPRPCPSWTPLSMTSLSALLLRPPGWPTTTGVQPSPAEKSRLLSGCCCLVSWPSTPCLRAPRLSPSTPSPSKVLAPTTTLYTTNGSSQSPQTLRIETCFLMWFANTLCESHSFYFTCICSITFILCIILPILFLALLRLLSWLLNISNITSSLSLSKYHYLICHFNSIPIVPVNQHNKCHAQRHALCMHRGLHHR